MIKGVDDDEENPTLPLIFTHIYDTVEINTAVPWPELDCKTQRLAMRLVDHYRMQASIRVDAQVNIKSLNVTSHSPEGGMIYSLIATVEALGDNDFDVEELFGFDEDEDDE